MDLVRKSALESSFEDPSQPFGVVQGCGLRPPIENVVLMAGDDTKGHPAGTKTGDAIHVFQSGSIQMITDVGVDPAGNVWAANNWDNIDAVVSNDPPRPISTQAGGQGIVVIYGVAAPVKTPLMGQVRKP